MRSPPTPPHTHTRRCKRGKIRKIPLSALTRDNKREREGGETQSLSYTDGEMNVRHSNTATTLLHYTRILTRPVLVHRNIQEKGPA